MSTKPIAASPPPPAPVAADLWGPRDPHRPPLLKALAGEAGSHEVGWVRWAEHVLCGVALDVARDRAFSARVLERVRALAGAAKDPAERTRLHQLDVFLSANISSLSDFRAPLERRLAELAAATTP